MHCCPGRRAICQVTLAVTLARSRKEGPRGIYVVGAVLALYLNVFVLLAQLFLRLPALMALAPTQKEPPFLLTQTLVLALFVWLGFAAVKGFRAETAAGVTARAA